MKHEALLGRTIAGKYQVEALVGQGAMGAVYKARQITLGTTLALKVLHQQLAGDPMFAARFLREAQAASRVDHPSSMRVLDFGEEPDGLLYIAMEYVHGKTLAQILDEEGVLPVARIVDIASQTLAALAVAHDLGVIHRDIKPENIMIIEGQDDEGRTHDLVKVCDFGVAKLLEGGSRAPSVTAEGLVVGTPEYMSPEQAQGETLDVRSDIYSMGVLLFHLMTGKVPFDASTAFGTAFMHVNDEPTRPRLLNPRVDSRLELICLKAMRKRREDRYATARELRTELRALLGHDDAYAEEGPGVEAGGTALAGGLLQQMEGRPRRTGLVIAGLLVAASVVAGVLLYPRQDARPADESVQNASITSGLVPAPPRPVPVTPAPAESEAPAAVAAESLAPSPRAHAAAKINARRSGAKTRGAAASAAAGPGVPPLPGPNPAPSPSAQPGGAVAPALADAPASSDQPAAAPPPAPAGVPAASDKPAPADKPAASDKPAPADKPAAADKPADQPAARKQPDPADAPLPVFPIPDADPAP